MGFPLGLLEWFIRSARARIGKSLEIAKKLISVTSFGLPVCRVNIQFCPAVLPSFKNGYCKDTLSCTIWRKTKKRRKKKKETNKKDSLHCTIPPRHPQSWGGSMGFGTWRQLNPSVLILDGLRWDLCSSKSIRGETSRPPDHTFS